MIFFLEISEGVLKCPLCHEIFEEHDSCWREHLMGEPPCSMNVRAKTHQKQVKIQT